ncbi:MAG: acylneuraminate cytidylyltransferase family protein [Phycisphaerales bacterium]
MHAPDQFVALVPMRHASERIPNKNFKPFRGLPLYAHIVGTLVRCRSIRLVVIDTDSPAIENDCRHRFPSVRLLRRPEHLRDGAIPMNDVLRHTVGQIDGEWFLQTHSTNPLLRVETIERAIDTLRRAWPDRDSLFGVTRWQTRLYDHDGRPINHDPAVLARTQDLPPVFEENSNLYLFSRSVLASRGQRIGAAPVLFEIDRLEAVDIDDDAGWRLADAVAMMDQENPA